MSDWIRALGIDYGEVRIGLAVSDDIGLLAHPLETVPGGDAARASERIAAIVAERGIRDVVIGLPLRLDGREGRAVRLVREFSARLREALPDGVALHESDERHSSREARAKLELAGRKRKLRAVLDQAAAAEILQQWLDERAPEPAPPANEPEP